MKKMLALFFTLGALFAVSSAGAVERSTACPIPFSQNNLCADIEFAKGPFNGDESQFIVRFFTAGSAAGERNFVDAQNLKVDLWMNMGHHGHGSSPVKVVHQSTGTYYVSEAYFVMAGRWNIRLFVNGEQSDLLVDVKP